MNKQRITEIVERHLKDMTKKERVISFLIDRFGADNLVESYVNEWINRFNSRTYFQRMDNKSRRVWLSSVNKEQITITIDMKKKTVKIHKLDSVMHFDDYSFNDDVFWIIEDDEMVMGFSIDIVQEFIE